MASGIFLRMEACWLMTPLVSGCRPERKLLREGLQTFIDHTNATVTGTAKVRLFKGRAMQVGAVSPHTLYDPQLASFSMEGYDVTAARGFIDLFGLPMKVASQRKRW